MTLHKVYRLQQRTDTKKYGLRGLRILPELTSLGFLFYGQGVGWGGARIRDVRTGL